jgi:hypothetical protein
MSASAAIGISRHAMVALPRGELDVLGALFENTGPDQLEATRGIAAVEPDAFREAVTAGQVHLRLQVGQPEKPFGRFEMPCAHSAICRAESRFSRLSFGSGAGRTGANSPP